MCDNKTASMEIRHHLFASIATAFLTFGCSALASTAATIIVDFPAPGAEYQAPNGAAAPGESFRQTFAGSVVAGAPIISEWNVSTGPGQSLTLTGTRFSLEGSPSIGTDTSVWISDGRSIQQAEIDKVAASIMTVTLPGDLSYGMYFIWVENSAGISAPVAINRTEAQWIGPLGNIASPGQTKRVFGRDLSTAHGTTNSYVYLQPGGGGPLTSATITSVNPYAVAFTVPTTLAPGTYNVYVHNGHGGRYGWSGPITLAVAERWVRGYSVSVVQPSGGPDDSTAIQTAINTAGGLPNGGTVKLNAGTYTIESGLTLPSNVELEGAGKDATKIDIEPTKYLANAIEIDGNRVELRGITFELVNTGTDVAPRTILGGGSFPTAWQDITWDDIRATASGATASTWANNSFGTGLIATRFEVSNSEFFREFAPTESDIWIHNNTFHGGTYQGVGAGTEAAVEFQAVQRVVMENSTFATPVRPEDWTAISSVGLNIVRRMFVATAGVASVQHMYIAHNTGTDVAPGPGENKGEVMLFHGASGNWHGQVISNSGTTMTVRTDGLIDGKALTFRNYGANSYSGSLTDPLFTNNSGRQPVVLPSTGAFGDVGMFASIVGGAGIGQLRQVAGVTLDTVTVSSPWRVPPDSSSIVVLGHVYKDNVLYDNEISAFPAGVWTNSGASTLIDFDGNSWFNVAESNTVNHTFNAASVGADAQNQSEWNLIENNRFLNLQAGGMSLVFWSNSPTGSSIMLPGPVTLGNVYRNNTVQITGPVPNTLKNPHAQDSYYQIGSIGGIWPTGDITAPFPYHESNIFENNTATGGRHGIWAGDYADTLYRGNALMVDSVTSATSSVSFTPNPVYLRLHAAPILRGNSYAGGFPTYEYESKSSHISSITPLSPSITISVAKGLSAAPISVQLLRSGTTSGSYTASSAQPWIVLPNPMGAIGAEQTIPFEVLATAAALAPGSYKGQVLISDGYTTVYLGVNFTVTRATTAPRQKPR